MARQNIITTIDVGTTTTRIVVVGNDKETKEISLIGTGLAQTRGMRDGYVYNAEEVGQSIKRAIVDFKKNNPGIDIRKAFYTVGGIALSSEISIGTAVISKADNEVTALDIEKSIKESEIHIDTTNKKILSTIVVAHRIDGKEVYGNPEGMIGVKLETKVLLVSTLSQHLDDLESASLLAGVDVIEFIPSVLAGAESTLSEKQKVVGVALVVIGGETVSIGVFENGNPIGIHTFNIGASDITNDIALGLKISLEEAENIKIGGMSSHPKKKIDEIIHARLEDICDLINGYLKKLKRNGLLPAGVVCIGGGAQISGLESFVRDALSLPSQVGISDVALSKQSKLRDPSMLVVYGGCLYGLKNKSGYEERKTRVVPFKESIKRFLDQFRP
jgi:cell division protein FtsA